MVFARIFEPLLFSFATLLFPSIQGVDSQPQSPEDQVIELAETIITPTRAPRKAISVPYTIEEIDSETIYERNYRSLPQIFRDTPGIMVQETAPGHGSPYIRGFTSFRNLFLIDGIRLNNSVFRSGPNQYWSTVDSWSLSEIEVVKGPSSVLYGSDAIGGTVNALTSGPFDQARDGVYGDLQYRWSSAEDSNQARVQAGSVWQGKSGVQVGITGKNFGDLRGGDETGRQRETGYSEVDADLKYENYLDPSTRFVFGMQHVYQNDVPRTHRTIFAVPFEGTTVGSDLRRVHDQERTLAYAQLHGEDVDAFFDSYQLSLSYHAQNETRHRTRSSLAREDQGFEVDTLGLFANFGSNSSIGRLTYGFDFYHDEVDSFRTGEPIQGPVADDSSYDLGGIYLQDEIEINEKLDAILGARFNYAAADADAVEDPVSSTKTSITEDWTALVGSARLSYALEEDETYLFGGVSQGFRAPNLSDLTRFDSARTNEFEIPSPDLDAERSISYEVGVKTQQERVAGQMAFFYTEIEDQIVRVPTGNTNGMGEFEITKDNVGEGFVYGIELEGDLRLTNYWSVFFNGTYQYGKVDTFRTSAPVAEEDFLSRLMPLTAQLGLRFDNDARDKWGEALVRYADDADKLSTRDASDTSRIPPGGTPSYTVFSLRGGWQITESADLVIELENLTDEDYRVHGSGHNMPGRGVNVGLRVSL